MRDGISLTGSTGISCMMKFPFPQKIKIGSTTCWHGGDLEALLEYYRGGESPTTGTNPGKLLATFQYLSGFSPFIHSDVFHWTDPMPGITEHWELAAKALQYRKRRQHVPAKLPCRNGRTNSGGQRFSAAINRTWYGRF